MMRTNEEVEEKLAEYKRHLKNKKITGPLRTLHESVVMALSWVLGEEIKNF